MVMAIAPCGKEVTTTKMITTPTLSFSIQIIIKLKSLSLDLKISWKKYVEFPPGEFKDIRLVFLYSKDYDIQFGFDTIEMRINMPCIEHEKTSQANELIINYKKRDIKGQLSK